MWSILIVEADTATSDAWATAFVVSGYSVLIASGMREALMTVRDGGIDVVVVDVYEPRAGIVELAHGLNALPDAPPIILVSASPAAPRVSVRIGAAAFVPKPCEPAEIVAAVGRLLGHPRPVFRVWDEPTGPVRQAS